MKEEMLEKRVACVYRETTLISSERNEKMKNKLAELGENLNDGARVAEKNMIPKEFPSYASPSRFSFTSPSPSTFKKSFS